MASCNIELEYFDFISDEEDSNVYNSKVRNMIDDNEKRLIININDLRKKCPTRAIGLLNNYNEEELALKRALKKYVQNINESYALEHVDFFVGFEGSFGNHSVTPRTLNTKFAGKLVCLRGIVTKCSLVRTKPVKTVHFCPMTKKSIEYRHTDPITSDFPSTSVYPTKDVDGNRLETEYGLSMYKNEQELTIQEMPEEAAARQSLKSVTVICQYDVVDCCKPGDRVQVVGHYRLLATKQSCFFKTIIIANNIRCIDQKVDINRSDVQNARLLAKKTGDMLDLLARSIAVSIDINIDIKKAIVCLLLGGNEKILPSGTRIRGDMHILLIGDPSVGKSQLLKYVLDASPISVATTAGRGSSGVGLTAAVNMKHCDRQIEAGAMILADRGVVCIDEFDKMSDIDRASIHEVMEQGRVTISKAGIHAKINAMCSVLAAGNPVYGTYDQHKTTMENIGLQESLLTRFDLVFVMLDVPNRQKDTLLADHVIRIHRYRDPKEEDGDPFKINECAEVLSLTTLGDNWSGIEKKKTSKFVSNYIHLYFVSILYNKLTVIMVRGVSL